MTVANIDEFYSQVCDFSRKYETRDLEEYLRALLLQIEVFRNEIPNFDLIVKILEIAFTSQSLEFQEHWLEIVLPPDANRMNQKISNKEVDSRLDKSRQSNLDGIEFTIMSIKFQISELRKMKGRQLKDEMRYFGVDSQTDHRWYNFDPFAILECGTRCVLDNLECDEGSELILDWSFIGDLFENGRVYE